MMNIKSFDVGGNKASLYGNDDKGFTISDSGGWIVGIFDSEKSAMSAFELSLTPNGHELLYELSKRVNRVYNENRMITIEDLEDVKRQKL